MVLKDLGFLSKFEDVVFALMVLKTVRLCRQCFQVVKAEMLKRPKPTRTSGSDSNSVAFVRSLFVVSGGFGMECATESQCVELTKMLLS